MRGVPRLRRRSRSLPRPPPPRTGSTRPADDGVELRRRVVVQPSHEPEPVPQWAGHEPGPGGGADQGEAGQVEPERAGARPLAEDDVELEVLHGRVEDLLHGPAQPVDLVHEQHVPLDQVRQDGGQVPGAASAGPEVTRRPAPISLATIPASEVLPNPGGPANNRWSAGWHRRRAASSMISRCSLSWPGPRTRPGAGPQADLLSRLDRIGDRSQRTAQAPLPAPHADRRQLAQCGPHLLLHRPVFGQAHQRVADLLGPVAEGGQGGAHLRPDLDDRPVGAAAHSRNSESDRRPTGTSAPSATGLPSSFRCRAPASGRRRPRRAPPAGGRPASAPTAGPGPPPGRPRGRR